MNFFEMSQLCLTLNTLDDEALDNVLRSNPSYFPYAVASQRNRHHWADYIQEVSMHLLNQCKEGIPVSVWVAAAARRSELSVFIGVQDIWNDTTLTLSKKMRLLKKYVFFHKNNADFTPEIWKTISQKNQWDYFEISGTPQWQKWTFHEQGAYSRYFWDAFNEHHIVPAKYFDEIRFQHGHQINDYNIGHFLQKIQMLPYEERITVLATKYHFLSKIDNLTQEEKNDIFLHKVTSRWGHDTFVYRNLKTASIPWEVITQEFKKIESEEGFSDNLLTLLYILHEDEDNWPQLNSKIGVSVDMYYPIRYLLETNEALTQVLFVPNIKDILQKFRSFNVKNEEFVQILTTLKHNIKGYVPEHWYPNVHSMSIPDEETVLFLH